MSDASQSFGLFRINIENPLGICEYSSSISKNLDQFWYYLKLELQNWFIEKRLQIPNVIRFCQTSKIPLIQKQIQNPKKFGK